MTPKAFEPMDPQDTDEVAALRVQLDEATALARRLGVSLAEVKLERDTIVDDYKRTIETLGEWQALARRLGKVLGGISARCDGVHHRKDQLHRSDEPCPVEAEIRAALDELERMKK